MSYTATEWSTVEDKKKFEKHFKRFIESGMPSSLFPKWFYNRLSNCFGHIAHYDKAGFYATWFSSIENQLNFLRRISKAAIYGDPAYTYSDVERVIQDWVKQSGFIERRMAVVQDTHKKQRYQAYQTLKEEFEPAS